MLNGQREQRIPQFSPAVFDHIQQTGEGKQWAVVCWMFSVAHQQRLCFMFSDFTNILDFIFFFFFCLAITQLVSKKTQFPFWSCLQILFSISLTSYMVCFSCCYLMISLIWSRRVKSSLKLSSSFRAVLLSLVCPSVCPRHLSVLHLRLTSVGSSSPRHQKSCRANTSRLLPHSFSDQLLAW